ncbi:MAG: CoA-binding protein [Ferruginibacter sp.]
MSSKVTLILGASENPTRYSNLAVKRLLANAFPVVAIGAKAGQIEEIVIETEQIAFDNIDTISLYLNPDRQKEYYNYILALKPKRLIFNPGTENDELVELAQQHQIQTVEACTLVMLSTGQY